MYQTARVLFLVAIAHAVRGSYATGTNIDNKFAIETLRRKLTKDNYDYTSEDMSEDTLGRKERNRARDVTTRHTDILTEQDTKESTNYYISTRILNDIYSEVKHEHVKGNNKDRSNEMFTEIYTETMNDAVTTPKVRFKILKRKHKSRRAGRLDLIQAEGAEGVSILNVGGGPVPLLQLSEARGQYMRAGELVSDEEHLDPPPVDEEDVDLPPVDNKEHLDSRPVDEGHLDPPSADEGHFDPPLVNDSFNKEWMATTEKI